MHRIGVYWFDSHSCFQWNVHAPIWHSNYINCSSSNYINCTRTTPNLTYFFLSIVESVDCRPVSKEANEATYCEVRCSHRRTRNSIEWIIFYLSIAYPSIDDAFDHKILCISVPVDRSLRVNISRWILFPFVFTAHFNGKNTISLCLRHMRYWKSKQRPKMKTKQKNGFSFLLFLRLILN